MRFHRLLLLFGTLALAGCGYFNALYNAQRRFAEAERAERSGDAAGAHSGYVAAVERAANSYRRYPNSRWADDALFLIGRARFAMGEVAAAKAALPSGAFAQTKADTDIAVYAGRNTVRSTRDLMRRASGNADRAQFKCTAG